jgi:hypothetical protein
VSFLTQLHPIYLKEQDRKSPAMNCSTISEIENRDFLISNFGASIFMATYIGFYGMGLIVYFTCQFMTDVKESHEDEIPSNFFSTFHHINERQDIYSMI